MHSLMTVLVASRHLRRQILYSATLTTLAFRRTHIPRLSPLPSRFVMAWQFLALAVELQAAAVQTAAVQARRGYRRGKERRDSTPPVWQLALPLVVVSLLVCHRLEWQVFDSHSLVSLSFPLYELTQEIFQIVTSLITPYALFSTIFLQSSSLFHASGLDNPFQRYTAFL